ncbi:hypothetical protein EVAR_3280_1 [Eumeta japonica]|uniref:CRAL-TRIO domain-containing protein n=1 Tax=Eumeta variegata TaxID=151549 RepID=A0A4C1SV45_EUMVA|nr:hypothetical protein EVAR_3280_1 [Eumeta japonica]
MRRIAEFKRDNASLLDGLVPEDERDAFLNHKVVNVLKGRDHKGRRILLVSVGVLCANLCRCEINNIKRRIDVKLEHGAEEGGVVDVHSIIRRQFRAAKIRALHISLSLTSTIMALNNPRHSSMTAWQARGLNFINSKSKIERGVIRRGLNEYQSYTVNFHYTSMLFIYSNFTKLLRGTWDPKKVTADQLFRLFYLIHEAAMLEPETQVNGSVVIMDFHNMGWAQTFNAGANDASQLIRQQRRHLRADAAGARARGPSVDVVCAGAEVGEVICKRLRGPNSSVQQLTTQEWIKGVALKRATTSTHGGCRKVRHSVQNQSNDGIGSHTSGIARRCRRLLLIDWTGIHEQ